MTKRRRMDMKKFKNKKCIIACILITIILAVVIWNNIVLYKDNDRLRKNSVMHMESTWYQIYRFSEIIDKRYIQNNLADGVKFRLYVNQICHSTALRAMPSELTVNMSDLLALAYDPLFANLAGEETPSDREKASELLKAMNDDILLISGSIVDMKDREKEKLLDITSPEHIKVSAQVKEITYKYMKMVDDYFRNLEVENNKPA
jgi:hypothetical protein